MSVQFKSETLTMHIVGRNLAVFYLLLPCILVTAVRKKEGSKCGRSGAIYGICKRVKDCPLAIKYMKATGSPVLSSCGFVGFDQMVCCVTKLQEVCMQIPKYIQPTVTFQVYGGKNAEENEFPHMAALGYETDDGISWSCSASIISNHFLLTAAHCIKPKSQVPKVARLGITKLNDSNPQDFSVKKVVKYPKHHPVSKHNDIALIEVDGKISFTNKMYPACLYSEDDDPSDLIVTGWGKTSSDNVDDRSNILQKSNLFPTPIDKCNTYFPLKTIVPTQICAGSNESDACEGDSGGPLQIQNSEGCYSIVGIVSYGNACGGNSPGVYTRVSKYLEWIESIIY